MQPISLEKISGRELRPRVKVVVDNERKAIADAVEHIAEVERRKLFLDWGYRNLYEYLTKELGYCEASAYRHMQGARALRQIPELKAELENGALNLAKITQVQSLVKQEEKSGIKISLQQKKELLFELRHKTGRETQKILDREMPNSSLAFSTEKHKHDDSVEILVRLPKEEYEMLQRVKELYSHIIPNGELAKVVTQMMRDVIKARDPLAKKVKLTAKNKLTGENMTQSFSANGDKPTPATARFIFQRDKACQFRMPDGSICGSRHQLELDHIQPRFAGGTNDIENLRLLCRQHNVYRYERGK